MCVTCAEANSPLHSACERGHTECVSEFVESGYDLEARCELYRRTALMYAVQRNEECVRVLLNAGAMVNVTDERGMTALHKASGSARITHVEHPLGYLIVRTTGRSACIRLLLEHGALVNARDSDGMTALMYACRFSLAECVALLLEWGASVDAADTSGMTALHYACSSSYRNEDETACMRLLLERGAPVDALENNGPCAALMTACRGACVGKMRVLLEAGARVDLRDGEGYLAWMNYYSGTEPQRQDAAHLISVATIAYAYDALLRLLRRDVPTWAHFSVLDAIAVRVIGARATVLCTARREQVFFGTHRNVPSGVPLQGVLPSDWGQRRRAVAFRAALLDDSVRVT